ncbi:MAG: NUDIX hydrolase [Xanthomonadales bacterium]|nr:NUDIX hydrolase [Xanthomonadales bacterium]
MRHKRPADWLPAPEPNPWVRRQSTQIYGNPWISVREDQVVRPDGSPGIYGVVEPAGIALGVVPVDEEGFTWLVGQFRYPLDHYSWEIPEGGGDPEMDPAAEAARELREETGLQADHWEPVMTLHTSNCFTSEKALIFLATGLQPGSARPDGDERLQLCRLPLSAARDLVLEGMITDAMSAAGLLRVSLLLERRGILDS